MVGTPYLTLSKIAKAARNNANAHQAAFRAHPMTSCRESPRRAVTEGGFALDSPSWGYSAVTRKA